MIMGNETVILRKSPLVDFSEIPLIYIIIKVF